VKRFVWEESPKQSLRGIDREQAIEILRALTRVAKGEPIGNLKRLTGEFNSFYRWRFGDWRVLFKFEETDQVIHVFAVGNRKEVYR
jgi:mRNA interferase RelE/StbE